MILTFAWLGGGKARTVVWATDRRLWSFTRWAMIGLPQMTPSAQKLIQEQDTAEGVRGILIQCPICGCLGVSTITSEGGSTHVCTAWLVNSVAKHNTRIIHRLQ